MATGRFNLDGQIWSSKTADYSGKVPIPKDPGPFTRGIGLDGGIWTNVGGDFSGKLSGPTIPAGWVETVFTVDWASLDPDSPFTNAAFSAIVAGDSCVYDQTSVPDGYTVSMSGDGVFTITGIDADQSFDYFIYDISDGTSGTTDTISITFVPSGFNVSWARVAQQSRILGAM